MRHFNFGRTYAATESSAKDELAHESAYKFIQMYLFPVYAISKLRIQLSWVSNAMASLL